MRRAVWCLLVLVLVGPPKAAAVEARSGLPEAITNAVVRLRSAFARDLTGATASTVESSVTMKLKHFREVNAEDLTRVLGYARKSGAQADLLVDFLLSDLDRFSRQFGPGAKIDEKLRAKRTWGLEEAPSYGVTVDGLLLFDLAEPRNEPALTRRVLQATARAAEADANFCLQHYTNEHPAGRRESPPRFTMGPTGRELSWLCGRFLINADHGHTFTQPSAQRILGEYMQEGGDRSGFGDRTMTYALRLAEALPEK